jgi:hypothetical protein
VRMTKGAEAALQRGDEVYVHTLGNVSGQVRQSWINRIEAVGWRLEDQRQVNGPIGQRGALRWSLTFRRK